MKERPAADPVLQMMQSRVDANCRRCGKCCLNSRPISIRDHEVWRIAKYLLIPASEVRERFCTRTPERRLILKEPCPFLSPGGCLIYEVRPQVCRNFPFLSDVSRAAYAESRTVISTTYCPASNDAVAFLRKLMVIRTGVPPEETHSEIEAKNIDEELAEIRRLVRQQA